MITSSLRTRTTIADVLSLIRVLSGVLIVFGMAVSRFTTYDVRPALPWIVAAGMLTGFVTLIFYRDMWLQNVLDSNLLGILADLAFLLFATLGIAATKWQWSLLPVILLVVPAGFGLLLMVSRKTRVYITGLSFFCFGLFTALLVMPVYLGLDMSHAYGMMLLPTSVYGMTVGLRLYSEFARDANQAHATAANG